ncbi:Cytochrome C oxidase, mono-heme subunit/FixO [Lacunisphaera limnophila]|uniref:Cytochrome C oxidase, mono-heme subunit/FixO n=1 Tax=Lacunisphaera limnophila TaxID=1838286 RepID=A0A1D8AZT4_9BACT|nr:cbb3-type cytochrome c oxidase subunit II [Lacunisphaera limnophila]AOS46391.1 Cytochrome C oxidase, mono-heme subunit/FixO [Lacunisphaera limnophila]
MSDEPAGGRGPLWRGVVAVAATYGYFLLFAEFAFLALARAGLPGEPAVRVVMGALGAGGVAGSALALWRFGPEHFRRRLVGSYLACAVAAAFAPFATGQAGLALVAAGIGLALGWNTVTLASGLRALLPAGRLGLGAGLGTGLAYAACNVPVLFLASAQVQTWAVVVLAVLAALVVAGVRPVWTAPAPAVGRWPVARWVGAFLALVWLDSAAFYIIQQTPGLRGATWGEGHLWANALMHLGAAVAAGALLDRGALRGLVGVAWLALAVACLALGSATPWSPARFFYTGGVSLYSAALVYFAARDGRPAIAAAVFAIAGWVGSALGIGMAQDLHGIPWPFVLASGAGLLLCLWPRRRAAVALLALGVFLPKPLRAEASDPLVAQGREVYIAEGCIHCHSQYIRPGVAADVERWGPARPLAALLAEAPPLPGNRRQGPDLANVGNRRYPEWNRVHLQKPRALSPGSRMPAYAHLFADGDGRGEALVAYLASLGADTLTERWEMIARWQPDPTVPAISARAAARLFERHCVACHGSDGQGQGPLAGKFTLPPPNWLRDEWRRAPGGDETLLARLIKFGAPGTAMAGHETLSDAEIAGLVRHVKSLHR